MVVWITRYSYHGTWFSTYMMYRIMGMRGEHMAKRKIKVSYSQLAVGSLVLAILSWMGFLYFTFRLPPNDSTLPLFFLILFIAVTSSVIPLTTLIDGRRRKASKRRRTLWRPIRRGLWAGFWVTLCAWLQWVQLLNWVIAFLFLIIFAMIEWFIVSRK